MVEVVGLIVAVVVEVGDIEPLLDFPSLLELLTQLRLVQVVQVERQLHKQEELLVLTRCSALLLPLVAVVVQHLIIQPV